MTKSEIEHELRAIELAIANKSAVSKIMATSSEGMVYRDIVARLTEEESAKLFKSLAGILKAKANALRA